MTEEQRQALIARIAVGRQYWADREKHLTRVCGRSLRGEEVTIKDLVSVLANDSMIIREIFALFDAAAEAMEKM